RSDERIGRVKAPLLVLHGEQDRIVPIRFGERLFARANDPKQMVRFPSGGHVNLDDHGAPDAVRVFLNGLPRMLNLAIASSSCATPSRCASLPRHLRRSGMSGLRKPAEIFGIPAVLASIVMSLAASPPAQAQQSPAVLFQNVRIFDGKNGALSAPSNVLVRNNKIERISAAAITAEAQVVNGGGRVLMPGLIDAHWHAMLVRPTPVSALTGDVGYNNLLAAAEATSTLMRGFTTIRDLGGPTFGLKQAIDEGLVAGPRIYPSGAVITVTSGHGDFRQLSGLPRTIGGMLSRMEKLGASMVADSPDEVR